MPQQCGRLKQLGLLECRGEYGQYNSMLTTDMHQSGYEEIRQLSAGKADGSESCRANNSGRGVSSAGEDYKRVAALAAGFARLEHLTEAEIKPLD